MARRTFAQAREEILSYLRTQGWKVETRSARAPWGKLKEPRAISPGGGLTLTFKTQAVYAGAHSTWLDIRDFDGNSFLWKIREMYGAAANRSRYGSRAIHVRRRTYHEALHGVGKGERKYRHKLKRKANRASRRVQRALLHEQSDRQRTR